MASSRSLLSEEQLLCSICLDVFKQPVSTPCGHNFCMICITQYWSTAPDCRCPICKETFERIPDLKVNTFISELASQFQSLQMTEAVVSGAAGPMLCDVCTDPRHQAVKSCLECLTAFCEPHLEPHHRAAGLRRHTLVDPVPSLEGRTCREHPRLLSLFCRDDQALLCDVCARSHHVDHDYVPLQRASAEKKVQLKEADVKLEQMIQERRHKVRVMKESVEQNQADTADVIAKSIQDLTALVSEIQKSQAELVEVMEEKQKAAEREAEGFIKAMEQEITQLQATRTKLQELKQSEDHVSFLQSFPHPALNPHTMDLSSCCFNRHGEINNMKKCVRETVAKLHMLLGKLSTEIQQFSDPCSESTLRFMQQYEEEILLDPETAHPLLVLSGDRRQVSYRMRPDWWVNQDLRNPKMFIEHLAVLGERGFSSRRFYFEVWVGEKTEWCVGVASEAVQRKGSLQRSPDSGLWAIWFLEDRFETFCCPDVAIHLGKVERVGVFVDYDKGRVSFYDTETAALIHSFSECVFVDDLYPYFNPCDNEYGSNLGPMAIVPASHP